MSLWGKVYVIDMSESRQCKSKDLEDRDILIFRGYSKVTFSKAYISRCVGIWETNLISVWGHWYANFMSESRQCMSKGLQDRGILIFHGYSKVNFSKAFISRCVRIWEKELMSLWGHVHVNFMSESRQCTSKGLQDRELLLFRGYSKVNFSKAYIFRSVGNWETKLLPCLQTVGNVSETSMSLLNVPLTFLHGGTGLSQSRTS
jgi:hypothetical protein